MTLSRNQNRFIAIFVVCAILALTTIVIPFNCGHAEYPAIYLNGDLKKLSTGVGELEGIATLNENNTIHLLLTKMPSQKIYKISAKEITDSEGMLTTSINQITLGETQLIIIHPVRKRSMVIYFDDRPMFMLIRR